MKVSLILGKGQGNNLKQRLLDIRDNMDIDCFDSIPEFIDNAMKRNQLYDRILILSNKMSQRGEQDLYNYWSNTSKDTQIVLLGKKGNDESKAKEFLNNFKTPVVASVLSDTFTVSLIADAILQPTFDLNKKYGPGDFLVVEVEDFSGVQDTPKPQQQVQQPVQNQQVVQQQGQQVQQQPPKKKGGFLSNLFGRKNKNQQTQQPPAQQTQQPQWQTQNSANYNNVASNNQAEIVDGQTDYNFQGSISEHPIQNVNQQYTQNNNMSYNEQSNNDFSSFNSSNNMNSFNSFDNAGNSFSEMNSNQQNFNNANYEKSSSYNGQQAQSEFNDFEGQNNNNSFDTVEESFDSVSTAEDDFAPESWDTYNDTPSNDSVEQVADDFGGESLGDAESQYRQATEAPKVITETVVREVIRNVNTGGKNGVLDGVYSGRLQKTVIVTGDRGTGVTSTALAIATELAKKINVLYYDCDIANHGLMNYIDYEMFGSYEENHMHGVKRARSSMAFDSCIVSWTDNLYLLTSDFSCEATKEDLINTTNIVAERAVDFGVVVVDCPSEYLPCIEDLVLTGQSVICVEGSKRGFMNMLCQFESNDLAMRHKRTLASAEMKKVCENTPNLDLKQLLKYIRSVWEPNGVDWFAREPIQFNGKITDKLLGVILEG